MRLKRSTSTIWTPRSIFIIAFLCCISLARAAESAQISPRFDPGSASLALKFQSIKDTIPHPRIPTTSEKIQKTDEWAMDYGIGLVKVVGTGFAIALLSVLIGVLYGVFKLIRMCCCCCCRSSKSDGESEYDDEKSSRSSSPTKWIPTGIYAVCWVFLFTGMIFGILNNPRFTDGVGELGGYVINVQSNAILLGESLLSGLGNIIAQVPRSIKLLLEQISGVDGMGDEVVILGEDVEATSSQVSNITSKVGAIDAGNTSVLASLNQELARINNSSQRVISQIYNLTSELNDNLRSTVNATLSTLDVKLKEINESVSDIEDSAEELMDQARSFTKSTTNVVNDAKSYDESRGKAVTALFSFVIVVSVSIVAGYFLSMKLIFNVVAAFGFSFCFLLWFSGSIHFLLGMALSDACPIIDTVATGMIISNNTGDGGKVLEGCLFNTRTVLQSMDKVQEFNLTKAFNYQEDFEKFNDFANSFNFSTIDDYFTSVKSLYTYNLSALAANLTVANFGWNESYIYTALDGLNNQTFPDYFSLSNYTAANPNNYAPPNNQTVYDLKIQITTLLDTNVTIYNKTATARAQLIDAQRDIDVLLANFTQFDLRYDHIKDEFQELRTENITNCLGILENLKANVSDFLQSGNCSFVGETYRGIIQSLCGTMQPAIDLLTVAQFLAGIALIPMTIVAELMSFRIAKLSKVSPCGSDDIDEESGQRGGKRCEYAIALTDSTNSAPNTPVMRHSITATIADVPNPAGSTPDMHRRIIRGSGNYN